MQVFNWHQLTTPQTTHSAYLLLHSLSPFSLLSLAPFSLSFLCLSIVFRLESCVHSLKYISWVFYLHSKTSYSWLNMNMYGCTLHTYMLGCLLLHWLTEFFGFRYISNSSKHSKKNTKIINKFVTNFSTIFHFRLSLFSSNFRVRINERVPVSVCE